MIQNILTKEVVRTGVAVKDWQEAIHEGMKPLLAGGYVEPRYEEAVFASFQEMGPYMVIAPGVVLSHARPEHGVLKMGMSIVNLEEGVKFHHETNDPVYLVITLAASDNTAHLEVLRELMAILMEESKLETLMFEKDLEKVLALFAV